MKWILIFLAGFGTSANAAFYLEGMEGHHVDFCAPGQDVSDPAITPHVVLKSTSASVSDARKATAQPEARCPRDRPAGKAPKYKVPQK